MHKNVNCNREKEGSWCERKTKEESAYEMSQMDALGREKDGNIVRE